MSGSVLARRSLSFLTLPAGRFFFLALRFPAFFLNRALPLRSRQSVHLGSSSSDREMAPLCPADQRFAAIMPPHPVPAPVRCAGHDLNPLSLLNGRRVVSGKMLAGTVEEKKRGGGLVELADERIAGKNEKLLALERSHE